MASGLYLIWWWFVHVLMPEAINPVGERLLVAGFPFAFWALSFVFEKVRRHLFFWVRATLWLITAHYFYMVYINGGTDPNWVPGSFIVVLAVTYVAHAPKQLLSYSAYVTAIGIALYASLPALRASIFLPGLFTILLQANVMQHLRNRMLARVRESNDKFETLFHASSEGVLLHENGRVQEANEALVKMLGYQGVPLRGRNVLQFIYPADREVAGERLRNGEIGAVELRGLHRDGYPVFLEVRAKRVMIRGALSRLVTVRDLTLSKRAEEERLVNLAMAAKVRALDDFIALASHELRTPVTSIKLWMQMLERESRRAGGANARRVQEVTSLVGRQIRRLTALIETMLDTSQISAGRLAISKAPVNLSEVLRASAEGLYPESERARTPIRYEAAEPAYVVGDSSRISQMVDNLLSNGIKYGNHQPVDVSLREESGDVVLRVKDHGIGIRPENLARIFDRFERADPVDSVSGLGLGLYLVRQLAEAHGGSIDVESELGEGSVFTLRLPASGAGPPLN